MTDDLGSGRPLLLLHGGAGPLSVRAFGGLLAEDFRVLVPTIPGFDGTPRPDHLRTVDDLAVHWLDLLAELDLRDVTVVGSSVGGWTAARMALEPGDRVGRVVLLDAVGIDVPGQPIAMIDPASLPPERAAVFAANAAVLASYAGEPYMHDPTLRARLAGVRVPTLVVWGESDAVVTPDYGRAYAAAIPGAEFVLVEGAGHLPQMEQPERTRALVREFAAR
ncbi:alpha/beta hydrolase [Pseudonocardia ailaonensis]|uniref:Alpha/beta hydrolase n=1 Tax=Pseudonocardia ailaonensis TaxID=367279 RepID=A0ABN2NDU3_9PSEU